MGEYKSDFVIITALNKPEFEELKRAVDRLGGRMHKSEGSPGVYVGEIGPAEKTFRFYAVSQLYPGMVSAATMATKMIGRYRPKYIVMLGIAAGFADKEMRPGSVLIADFVANYQQGKTSEEGFQRDTTGLSLDAGLRGLFDRHKDDIMSQLNKSMAPPSLNLQAYIGPIVTGSQVVASQAIMDGIKNSFRKVVGVEMEGFAIFQAAAEADDPKPSPILIKSVCDFGDESKNDASQELAAYTSAYFFLKFALDCLGHPTELDAVEPSGVELTPWQHQKDRERARLTQLLDKCNEGRFVKFISITGKSFLDPEIERFAKPKKRDSFEERDPFVEAIRRGVKFRGILLDPEGAEADCRSKIESPGKTRDNSLLVRDAASVMKRLESAPEDWKKNLQIHYSQIGLSFKLWLFENEAYIEPYHFGKQEKDRLKPESPLCGFSHIWIKRSAPEYELLEDHFEQLWCKCKKFWPTH